MTDPLLKLESVGLKFKSGRALFGGDAKTILRDISFSIYAGETLGVIGRNGAGKSSLLRILAGVFSPDEGVLHRNCNRVQLLSLELGFSEQLSGLENIILSGLYHGFSKREMRDKTSSIISLSGLEESIENPLVTYSSGMRARLGFSIAYYLNPDILLIDEVLGVGDVDFQFKSEALIKEKMNSNQTVVLVTHDYELVNELCNRAVWIENGELHAHGDARSVLRKYLRHMNVAIEDVLPD